MCTRSASKLVYVHSHCIIIHDKNAVHTVIMLQYYISWEIWEYTESSVIHVINAKESKSKNIFKTNLQFSIVRKEFKKKIFQPTWFIVLYHV